MDKEENRSPFIIGLLRSFVVNFSLTVLVISIAGIVVIQYAAGPKVNLSKFAFNGNGLAYGSILQLAGFSLIMAVWILLFFSERFFKKTWFFWRYLFLFLATLISFLAFTVIFKWFPVDNFLVWLSFILGAAICFGLSCALTVLKLKIEGKKYNKLLANYKARRKA
jgi:hypothetical protein